MKVGVVRETLPGERRVALVPDAVSKLIAAKLEVAVQAGAGSEAFYTDDAYQKAGATLVPDARTVLGQADALLKVQPPSLDEVAALKSGAILIGFLQPSAHAEVEAYDVRPAVKDEVKSLGATFVELPLEAQQGQGGYAAQQSEEFLRRQRELIGDHVAASDVVTTTAAVPGRKAPILATKDMVARMRPGSVIVDLAADTGGNVELTKLGGAVVTGGVTVEGPRNLAHTMPVHARQLDRRHGSTPLLSLGKDC